MGGTSYWTKGSLSSVPESKEIYILLGYVYWGRPFVRFRAEEVVEGEEFLFLKMMRRRIGVTGSEQGFHPPVVEASFDPRSSRCETLEDQPPRHIVLQ